MSGGNSVGFLCYLHPVEEGGLVYVVQMMTRMLLTSAQLDEISQLTMFTFDPSLINIPLPCVLVSCEK